METNSSIEELLENLDLQIKLITQLGKECLEIPPGFYMFDIYTIGILNRSVNIIKGFSDLIRSKNFIAAAPLVRVHVDTLLRLYAPQLINFNVDEFAKLVFSGTPVRNIKDISNKNLTDTYLVSKLNQVSGFDWVQKVYDTGNAFIHFSDQTIFASMKPQQTEMHVNFTIGLHDNFISDSEKHGSVFWMNKITEGIIILTNGWVDQKKSYL
ncbi:MAG: hypothetical protein J0L83_08275 [Chitinophagales bacterium]|nr:hypothetical protein [Chitinophagales bacterium]